MNRAEIDWQNPRALIAEYFRVKDALWLPKWQVMHVPSLEEMDRILITAKWMDTVRKFLKRPITVHCWIRPNKAKVPGSRFDGQDYNAEVGGAPRSAHILGRAVDFDAGWSCSEDRNLLVPKLFDWELRMEDRLGPWIHLDDMPCPSGRRFFKP